MAAAARSHAPPAPPRPAQAHAQAHKKACKAYVLAATIYARQLRLCKEAVETDRCLVCLEKPRDPTTLPCGHTFCTGCVSDLREKGVSETCPLCRAPLPPGSEKLFELANRVWLKIIRAVGSDAEWPPLSAPQQEVMRGAIVMLQEAMDQVSGGVGGSWWEVECHGSMYCQVECHRVAMRRWELVGG